jgi:LuxR family transcriptional regulator, transcriptional activator of the bioluminescence operon
MSLPTSLLVAADDALRVMATLDPDSGLESWLADLTHRLGFDYFSYVLADSLLTSGRAMLASSYPRPWQQRYEQRRYQTLDPVVTVGSRMRRPFFWGSTAYLRALPPARRRLFDEARDFRIIGGFTVPVHGPGGECGLFSVASATGVAACEDAAQASGPLLQLIGAQLHAAVAERRAAIVAPPPARLTEHERVCLAWTLRGKTAWEIAQIVNRSRPTIDFHLQKAIRKLGAANKSHAAFLALQAGLI